MPLSRRESLGDFRCGGGCGEEPRCVGWLAATFFSEAVMVMVTLSSVREEARSGSMSESGSGSREVVRSERGRLPWLLLRGLGGASFTGEGEREGSFSLEVEGRVVSLSSSDSGWLSLVSALVWFDGRGVTLGFFVFIVKDWILVPLRGRRQRAPSCSGMSVPGSSPLDFASTTAFLRSGGTGAWIDVMSFA